MVEKVQRVEAELKLRFFSDLEFAQQVRVPDVGAGRAQTINLSREQAMMKSCRTFRRRALEVVGIESVVKRAFALFDFFRQKIGGRKHPGQEADKPASGFAIHPNRLPDPEPEFTVADCEVNSAS